MKIDEKKTRVNMRMYFMLIIMSILLGAYLLSNFLIMIINSFFDFPSAASETTTNIILSIMVGGFLASLLSKIILYPITRLNEQMGKVADGDFGIKIETQSMIDEFQELYGSFNQMVKDLASTETLQMDFISNVSHEFKTPINAIEGYATLLLGSSGFSEEQSEYVQKILFNTKRLSGLTSNILLLAKIDNQTLHTKIERYRLDEQIRQAILALEQKWTEKDINLDVELEELFYTGNEALLFHAWRNLIDNAVKFSPVRGCLEISLYVSEQNVIFAIRDYGPGIPEQEQRKIFDKFYQSDCSHTDEGNGLGLALVKRIIAVHGGVVEVENQEHGGCKFSVILPPADSNNRFPLKN